MKGVFGGGGSAKIAPQSLTDVLPRDQVASAKPHPTSTKYAVSCDPDGHPDGAYLSCTKSGGRYHNVAASAHMLTKLVRRTSGAAHMVDWQLNLRGGLQSHKPDAKWRRYFSKPQQSFDAIKENCGPDNAAYQESHVTPRHKKPDRRAGGLTIEQIRNEPFAAQRLAGCEGTQVGQWGHLIKDKKHGAKHRSQLAHETSIRVGPGDESGSRLDDNRTDVCVVEMLGKKKWYGARNHNALAAHPKEGGDVRLHHLSTLKPEAEVDEDNRQLRVSRHPRLHAPEVSKLDLLNRSRKHTIN